MRHPFHWRTVTLIFHPEVNFIDYLEIPTNHLQALAVSNRCEFTG